jgi:hypothetical protein
VAKAVLEIAQAQYAPEEKPKTRYRMQNADEQSEYSDDDSECSDAESVQSGGSGPRIYSEIIGNQFTIDNVGQVSMKVNSRTRPLEMVTWGLGLMGEEHAQMSRFLSTTLTGLCRTHRGQ